MVLQVICHLLLNSSPSTWLGSIYELLYVLSFLLAALGGNSLPSAKDIKKILDSMGIEADDDRLNKVISELNGKKIEDVITQGIGKLASVPPGTAVAVYATAGSVAPAARSAPTT
nr:60S acidic ribosomal protein P2-like [Oryctolagus cuniculus]